MVPSCGDCCQERTVREGIERGGGGRERGREGGREGETLS